MQRSHVVSTFLLAGLLLGCGANNGAPDLSGVEGSEFLGDTCWIAVEVGPEDLALPRSWQHDAARPECSLTLCFESPDSRAPMHERAACRVCEGDYSAGVAANDLAWVRMNRLECSGDACGCETPWFEGGHQDVRVISRTESELVLLGWPGDYRGPLLWRFVPLD